MTPDRYKNIARLFDEALAQPAPNRTAWLQQACGDDDALYREVATLLANEEDAKDFLARPAIQIAASLLAQDSPPHVDAAAVGKQISHYRVLSLLGAGGMGEVYLAEDTRLHRKVALKLLPQRFLQDPEHLRRFKREALAASALNHPNILTIYEFGIEAETPFIATELVEGETLRQRLMQGKLPVSEAIQIAIQIVSALQAAHAAQIIHRDIKPENIMLRTDGIVKLLDFGLAKLLQKTDVEQNSADPVSNSISLTTQLGIVVGTAAYMSPEQARGYPIDARSDLFAVGVILFEMLTGKHPFISETVNHTIVAILEKESPTLAAFGLQAPVALEQIVQQALKKSVHTRYPSAAALLQALRQYSKQFDHGDHDQKALQLAPTNELVTQPLQHQTMQAVGNATLPFAANESALELAHVLFCDLVGYSLLPIDQQTAQMQILQKIVQQTADYQRANQRGQLVRLPAGDGMALAFLQDVTAPVRCACDIAVALQAHPELKLRSGIHSGPVYQSADINANRNVVGSGINLAQRVMDCGEAGHILVSHNIAEVLQQVSHWQPLLHDLGEHEVKHGVKIHLYNLYNDAIGNPATPMQLRAAQNRTDIQLKPDGTVALDKPAHMIPSTRPANRLLRRLGISVAAIVVAGLASIPLWQAWRAEPSAPKAAVSTERSLTYFLTVQRYRYGKPYQAEFQATGREIFESGWQFKLNVLSPQAGFLYLLNEDAQGNFSLLFPLSSHNNGSAHLNAQELFQTGAYLFDQNPGTERFRLIWAVEPVPEIETIRSTVNASNQGKITQTAHVEAIRAFLIQHSNSPNLSNKEAQSQRITIRGNNPVLVEVLELEHR